MERRLLVFVPAVAAAVAAFALSGPAKTREVVGARVLVADDAEGVVRSVRLIVVERADGLERPRAAKAISLTVDDREVWRGDVGSDGVVDVSFAGARSGPVDVRVAAADSTLARGTVESRRVPTPPHGGVHGSAAGAVSVQVEVPRGQLVPPFADRLRVVARLAGGGPARGLLHTVVSGAEVDRETSTLDGNGVASIEIRPIAQTADIELRVDDPGGGAGTFEGALPIGIGSIWLAPTSTRSRLVLAVRSPHVMAYVSLHDERGRIGGTSVALEPGADGIYRGEADIAAVAKGASGPLIAVVASDAEERGLTTVTWPVDPPVTSHDVPSLRRALDGAPFADAAERRRVTRARRITAGFLGAATLLEILLLVIEWRRSRRHLISHFARSSVSVLQREDVVRAKNETGATEPIVETSGLVASERSGGFVVIAVAAILLLAAGTLVALDFAAGGP